MKKASGNSGNKCNIGKKLNETKLLIKTNNESNTVWKTWQIKQKLQKLYNNKLK